MALRREQMKAVPVLLLLLLVPFGHTEGGPVPVTNSHRGSVLYPYGFGVGDATTPHEDDGMSPEIPLSEPFSFYGQPYKSLYVNNNGVVSFGTGVPEFTPQPFPLDGRRPFVAPYWADVDTRLGGEVFYRETRRPEVLARVQKDIGAIGADPKSGPKPTWAFVATWDRVPFYGAASNKTNTFQAVLATNGVGSFIILNYGVMEWTTGIANQGDPHTGLGGIPAQAGFNSADSVHFFSIPGSRTPAVLRINSTSNIGLKGRWVFRVDEFSATEGPRMAAPSPTTWGATEEPQTPSTDSPTTWGAREEPQTPNTDSPTTGGEAGRPIEGGTEEREFICH